MPNEGTIVHRPRVYGLAGLLGAAVFTLSLVVLHLARTEVAWTRDYVSHFANSPLGWVFASSALVHGVGNLALTLGLRSSLDPSNPTSPSSEKFASRTRLKARWILRLSASIRAAACSATA